MAAAGAVHVLALLGRMGSPQTVLDFVAFQRLGQCWGAILLEPDLSQVVSGGVGGRRPGWDQRLKAGFMAAMTSKDFSVKILGMICDRR